MPFWPKPEKSGLLHLAKKQLKRWLWTVLHQAGNQEFEDFVKNCLLLQDSNIHTATCSGAGRQEEATVLQFRS